MEDKLNEAIERSLYFTERVKVEVEDIEKAKTYLRSTDWEIDWAKENDDSLDIWGWNAKTPVDEQEWRLLLIQTGKE